MTALPPARRRAWILLAAAGALSACAVRGGYPSLAPRAIERPAADEAAAASAAPLPADAALDDRTTELARQATEGDAAFGRAAADGCTAIARGAAAAEGSEAWIAAQQALSALEAARAPVAAAAAALDQLVIDRGSSNDAAVDLSRLAAAQQQASALDAAEQARLAELAAGRCAG